MDGGSGSRVRERLARGWRGGAAGLVGLIGLALLALGPAGLAVAWEERSQRQVQLSTAHQVGDPVRDGPVTFVVHEVRCGAEPTATHGQRCEVLLGARNDGEQEVTFPTRGQTMHLAEGARHLPLIGRFEFLEPQQTATVLIRFDLPIEVTISHLELRANPYSRGVPVAVGEPYPLLAATEEAADATDVSSD